MSSLADRSCSVCNYDTPKLSYGDILIFLEGFPSWVFLGNEVTIHKNFFFSNFEEALVFFNKVASIAIKENHHPEMTIHRYRNVRVVLKTYAVFGLTENDFIMAAKIDTVYSGFGPSQKKTFLSFLEKHFNFLYRIFIKFGVVNQSRMP